MNIEEYLNKVAYIATHQMGDGFSECYFSKFDDSYMTHVGMEDNISYLAEREITDELTHGVGFSPKDGKWYGWSHRAIYGFEVGSTCKKGDCHYNGSSCRDREAAAIKFWEDEHHANVRNDGIICEDGHQYFDIKWDYTDGVPNEELRSTIGGTHHYVKPLGRGEWTAKTMSDAKQMAVDFNEGVS